MQLLRQRRRPHVDDRVLDALMSALNDHEDRVDWGAALSLGYLGDRRAVSALTALVQSEHVAVIDAALVALGAIGDPSVLPLVERIAAGQDGRNHGILEPNVRGAARRAVADIKGRAVGKPLPLI
jgi:HEAT repeat protein